MTTTTATYCQSMSHARATREIINRIEVEGFEAVQQVNGFIRAIDEISGAHLGSIRKNTRRRGYTATHLNPNQMVKVSTGPEDFVTLRAAVSYATTGTW